MEVQLKENKIVSTCGYLVEEFAKSVIIDFEFWKQINKEVLQYSVEQLEKCENWLALFVSDSADVADSIYYIVQSEVDLIYFVARQWCRNGKISKLDNQALLMYLHLKFKNKI
jgi:hypothetical protein